jgi:leucyl-tRNA synthetase
VEPLVIMLAPFAPHIAEELYQRLGHKDGLFGAAAWPEFDEAKAAENSVEIAVQVNGKLRARLVVGVDADEATVKAEAIALENVARHIEGKTVRKQIYVPGKLLNLVIG